MSISSLVAVALVSAAVLAGIGLSSTVPTTRPTAEEVHRYVTGRVRSLGSDTLSEEDDSISINLREHPAVIVHVVREELVAGPVDENPWAVRNVLKLYAAIKPGGEEVILPLVEPFVMSEDSPSRAAAVTALAEGGGNFYGPVYVAMLDDVDVSVSYAAIRAIGKSGGSAELQALKVWMKRRAAMDAAKPANDRRLKGIVAEAVREASLNISQRSEKEDVAAPPTAP